MSYKTILAYIPTPDGVDVVLDAVLPIATRNGAHLIGLHIVPEPHVYWAVAADMSAVVLDAQREFYAQLADKTEALFNARTASEDLVCEWRLSQTAGYPIAEVFTIHATSADLTVISQTEPSEDGALQTDLPSQVIMASGRPTLVLPLEWQPEPIGKRVAIAWDGRREATRAVFDALPFLTQAEEVRIVTVDEERKSSLSTFTPVDEIVASLQRYGITLTTERRSSGDGSIGEALLLYAQDHDSDLLVMGCYGHARFREFVFGGATRDILQLARLPVLMSH